MKLKIPGILGGLGPQTTANYYIRLQDLTRAHGLKAQPPLLIWNVDTPYDLMQRSIIEGTGFNDVAQYLIDGAQRLERAGADFIVMPCNTYHMFATQIRQNISIPFVSIIDETVAVIKHRGWSRVALLATSTTIHNRLYDVPFEAADITTIKPSKTDQTILNDMVIRLVGNREAETDKQDFQRVLDTLKEEGAEVVLLGCTDFHLVYADEKIEHIDTMEVLAHATIRTMCSE